MERDAAEVSPSVRGLHALHERRRDRTKKPGEGESSLKDCGRKALVPAVTRPNAKKEKIQRIKHKGNANPIFSFLYGVCPKNTHGSNRYIPALRQGEKNRGKTE